ncbi:hypothetical protein [Carboxylicivirga linearis]|uniref:Lipoprotein n=1 Tax=Carboxylicivirga linearis TaxID=1628157 RepID=A0ABS5K097_9BACT|nr:hypothetical protein [Carboxylicivirga linearis]MBS2100016.1 hypothetical protein [Carboxylicivirga linearis]
MKYLCIFLVCLIPLVVSCDKDEENVKSKQKVLIDFDGITEEQLLEGVVDGLVTYQIVSTTEDDACGEGRTSFELNSNTSVSWLWLYGARLQLDVSRVEVELLTLFVHDNCGGCFKVFFYNDKGEIIDYYHDFNSELGKQKIVIPANFSNLNSIAFSGCEDAIGKIVLN